MRSDIQRLAIRSFQKLSKRYRKFTTVFVDDWRGYRFVFDTEDTKRCTNDCANCGLFKLLKNEKSGVFSSGLLKATDNDKELFGFQNQLNCKTLEQYAACYVDFLVAMPNNEREIMAELALLRDVSILYSKNSTEENLEQKFKNDVLRESLRRTRGRKRRLIMQTMRRWNNPDWSLSVVDLNK